MYELKSNGIFWVRIPWSKRFADVRWPDSDWFPSQYCLFGSTHREICVCYQTDFPDCYSHHPHWLMWLHAFLPVSVDSLLGFSVPFNCIRCSPEFRDKVRKIPFEIETTKTIHKICEIRWKDLKGAVSVTFLFREICSFSHPPHTSYWEWGQKCISHSWPKTLSLNGKDIVLSHPPHT